MVFPNRYTILLYILNTQYSQQTYRCTEQWHLCTSYPSVSEGGGTLLPYIFRCLLNFEAEWGSLGACDSWVKCGVMRVKESILQPSIHVFQDFMWNTAKGYSINLTSKQKQSPKDSSTLQLLKYPSCSQHYKMLMAQRRYGNYTMPWETPSYEVLPGSKYSRRKNKLVHLGRLQGHCQSSCFWFQRKFFGWEQYILSTSPSSLHLARKSY